MAVLRVDNVGGIYPAQQPRNLPAGAGQVASNLLAGVASFRPLAVDAVVATAGSINPQTLYRLARTSAGAFNTDMTLGWITNPAVVNYVKSQIDDIATERTYYTYGDGSQPPRVTNAQGVDRPLGVVAPFGSPGAVLNAVTEFTTEKRDSDIAASIGKIIQTIQNNLIVTWIGTDPVLSSTPGYVNRQTAFATATTQDQQMRVYRTGSLNGANNGTIINTYCAYGPDSFAPWVWDGAVESLWFLPTNGTLAWFGYIGGSAQDHVAVPFYAYGRGYSMGPNMATALAALILPGTSATPLLTTAQITGTGGLIEYVTKWISQTEPTVVPKIQALTDKVARLKLLLDGGTIGGAMAERTAFYAKAEVAAAVDAAITNAANALYDAAYAAFHSAAPATDYTGSGNA
jgi:hypothetical protein